MLKLTEQQHIALLELVDSDGFKAIVQVVLPQIQQQYVDRLLSVDLNKSTELVIERARLDGATKIMSDIKNLKALLKKRA